MKDVEERASIYDLKKKQSEEKARLKTEYRKIMSFGNESTVTSRKEGKSSSSSSSSSFSSAISSSSLSSTSPKRRNDYCKPIGVTNYRRKERGTGRANDNGDNDYVEIGMIANVKFEDGEIYSGEITKVYHDDDGNFIKIKVAYPGYNSEICLYPDDNITITDPVKKTVVTEEDVNAGMKKQAGLGMNTKGESTGFKWLMKRGRRRIRKL